MSEQQELSLEEANASFAAGYAKVRGEEPPTKEAPVKIEEEAPKETEETTEPEEKPILDGLTPSQLKAKLEEIDQLRQENRRAFGKVGELNSRLQQFHQKLEQFQQQPPSQKTPAKLKRIAEDYPDLAEALSADLSEIQGSDPKEIDKLVGERVQSVADNFEMKLLTVKHPDWQQIAGSQEYAQWGKTIPYEEFEALNDSRDALEISSGLDKFKSWLEENRKQQAKAQAAEQQKAEKRQRLEAAATPNNGTAPPSGEKSTSESFRAGYERIAKARHS